MTNTNLRSDGRFMSGMFFRVLPAQIILLLLTGINNIVDGLVGSNFFGPTAASVIVSSVIACYPFTTRTVYQIQSRAVKTKFKFSSKKSKGLRQFGGPEPSRLVTLRLCVRTTP